MKFGISVYNVGPAELLEIARAADSAGFDSLWLGEHVILPCDYQAEHPTYQDSRGHEASHFPRIVDLETKLTDPWIGLAAAATVTERIKLATGVLILPLRHPLLTARAAATMAELSTDRFVLGVGLGWLEEEFDALSVPFEGRATRHREALEVLKLALDGGPFEYHGTCYQFRSVQVSHVPVHVPLVLGGNSDKALRRAAAFADGWFASGNPSFAQAHDLRQRLTELCAQSGRDVPRCYVRIPSFDPGAVQRYKDSGFDQVIFWAQDICSPSSGNIEKAFNLAAEQLQACLSV